jgi:SWI/SNF-related matrix-associated actin-dependent regulator 1 of chromatin subfamily A
LEQGKKVIVLTNFTMSLDMLHEKYKKNSVTLDGRMNKDRRQENVDRFQNDDKIKVFIGNIKAAGVGITLRSHSAGDPWFSGGFVESKGVRRTIFIST